MPSPVLATKLYIPLPRPNIVPRPRLIERLNNVLAMGCRLTLISASAGFGNRWGMPDSDVVARWRGAGTTVFATAQQGAVRANFPARPGPIEIDLARRDTRRWWRSAPAS